MDSSFTCLVGLARRNRNRATRYNCALAQKGFQTLLDAQSLGVERGRPPLDPEVKALVLQMVDNNPTWGAPKIHGELLKLGLVASERTVSGLLRRYIRKPLSQIWKTFIKNHMSEMVAVDFLVVPTIRFRMLYVFVVLGHANRQVIHFNVTSNPTAEWTAQQVIEVFPWDTAPRFLQHDRDKGASPAPLRRAGLS